MGYTTEFDGSVSSSPPLNAHEIEADLASGAELREPPLGASRGRGGITVPG